MMKRIVLALVVLFTLLDPVWAASRFLVGTGARNWDASDTSIWSATSGGASGASVPVAADNIFVDGNSGTGTITVSAAVGTNFSISAAVPETLIFNFTGGSTFSGTVTFTGGTTVTGAFTHNWSQLLSTTGTRTLTFDNSTINVNAVGGSAAWNVVTSGTPTYSATGATFNFTGGTVNTTTTIAQSGALAFPTVNITGAGTYSFSSSTGNTFAALTRTGTADKRDGLSFVNNHTITGTLTVDGNSATNRMLISSSTLGTARTITAAAISMSNVDLQDITAAGASSPWDLSAITGLSGDCGGNSNITFTTSAAQTMSPDQSWSVLAAWTSRVPLPQDDVTIFTGGTATFIDVPRLGRNIDFGTSTATVTVTTTGPTFYGNMAFSSAMTLSNIQTWSAQGRGSHTLTSNGKSWGPLNIHAFGGTYTLQDDLTVSTLTHTNGTIAAGAFAVSASTFQSISGTRSVTGTGTWSIAATGGTPWNATSGVGVTAFANITIRLTGAITAASFSGGGLTYGELYWSNTSTTGVLTIQGNNTFTTLRSDNTTARTWRFTAGTTQTVTNWGITGTPTTTITIDSSSAGSAATLSNVSGVVSSNYLAIKDSIATGGAKWYAGRAANDNGNNSGWRFRNRPALMKIGGRVLPL